MLTANEKDTIINNRGESGITGSSSKAYQVILTDGQCAVISLSGSDKSQIERNCRFRFGDRFVRLDG